MSLDAPIYTAVRALLLRLTPERYAKLDALDAAITSRAPAGSALSTATWTAPRAAALDTVPVSYAHFVTLFGSAETLNFLVADAALTPASFATWAEGAGALAELTTLLSQPAAAVIIGTPKAVTALAAHAAAMDSVAASAVAMTALIASSAAMATVTASATAMTALCANPAALAVLLGNRRSLDAIVASTVAMTAVCSNATALARVMTDASVMTTITASSVAMTVCVAHVVAWPTLAGHAGTMALVAASPVAMTALVANSAAMTTVAASPVAITALFDQLSARTALWDSATACAALFGNAAAVAQLKASYALTGTTTSATSVLISNKKCLLLSMRTTSLRLATASVVQADPAIVSTLSSVDIAVLVRVNPLYLQVASGGPAVVTYCVMS